MIYQAVGLRNRYRQVACTLVSIAQRTVKLFTEIGFIQKRKYPPNVKNAKLTEFSKIFLVIERPGIYLHEVKQLFLECTGIYVQESTICQTLKVCGLCRQKMALVANQRSELLKSLDVSIYQNYPELFVFVDEMGCDRRDRYRKFAYGWTPIK